MSKYIKYGVVGIVIALAIIGYIYFSPNQDTSSDEYRVYSAYIDSHNSSVSGYNTVYVVNKTITGEVPIIGFEQLGANRDIVQEMIIKSRRSSLINNNLETTKKIILGDKGILFSHVIFDNKKNTAYFYCDHNGLLAIKMIKTNNQWIVSKLIVVTSIFK